MLGQGALDGVGALAAVAAVDGHRVDDIVVVADRISDHRPVAGGVGVGVARRVDRQGRPVALGRDPGAADGGELVRRLAEGDDYPGAAGLGERPRPVVGPARDRPVTVHRDRIVGRADRALGHREGQAAVDEIDAVVVGRQEQGRASGLRERRLGKRRGSEESADDDSFRPVTHVSPPPDHALDRERSGGAGGRLVGPVVGLVVCVGGADAVVDGARAHDLL